MRTKTYKLAFSTKTMKISSLIFKELIKRGYSLEGKTRVWNIADSKLWYLTSEQAQGFLNLEQSLEYQEHVIQKEIDLISKNMEHILESASGKSINVIDLGCGDGKKAVLFITHLKSGINIRYCPIDISSYMVEKAMERIGKLEVGEVINFQWNISDFENLKNITPLLRDKTYKNNLILFLGNTLGNFEIHEILYQISESMQKGDVAVIGNGLKRGKNTNWLESYKDRKIDEWLSHILLNLGFTKDEIEYDVRFVNSRIEEVYIIKQNKKIGHLGAEIEFKQGDRVITAVSYKYSKSELINIMKMYFSDVKIYTDSKDSYALAVCKK